MLEEQLREVELRSDERLAEEERRHRELVARVDREKQLQVENCAIRYVDMTFAYIFAKLHYHVSLAILIYSIALPLTPK